MTAMLEDYARVAGEDVIDHLRQLAATIHNKKVVHVNSTRVGGGVAEILTKLVPLMNELGIDTDWLVINGEEKFYQCTKNFHNGLQGNSVKMSPVLLKAYEEANRAYADQVRSQLEEADVVVIHDPQPAPLLNLCPRRQGKWIWRCHIDASQPYRPVWKYLKQYITGYDASIFSLAQFARPLPHPLYLIPPSIDPLSGKNIDLPEEEINQVYDQFGLDPQRPIILQVSRFDLFKDPLGVIAAYKLAKQFTPDLQLVLAGGSASDDPEGEQVLDEVRRAANGDDDIHVLQLPPDAHRTINALQRAADIVLQKSLREGFGLTVTEALWKGKPVIGGETGGIRLQVINHHTGFLVNTPEGAALRIRYFLHNRDKMQAMGAKGRDFVRDNFLLTRHLREYLTLIVGLCHAVEERIELG